MIREGQIVLFRFPNTDTGAGKVRPALVLRELPSQYDDWLICMISSQLSQQVHNLDEVIDAGDPDFRKTGLKVSSVVRVSRLAVVEKEILLGSVGEIPFDRLIRIKDALANWIKGE